MKADPIIAIVGPTASGKTTLAIALARALHGHIISADSRQVYRGMDIGTGKELASYTEGGKPVPVHGVDLIDPGAEFSVYDYVSYVCPLVDRLQSEDTPVILCGGSGMYVDAVLSGYSLAPVPDPSPLRPQLDALSDDELKTRLTTLRATHNTTDTLDRTRLLRAVEIAEWTDQHESKASSPLHSRLYTVDWPPDVLRDRIRHRLQARLQNGLIEEVENLRKRGVSDERLESYGLEYRLITQHLRGELNRNDMTQKLTSAIAGFAKRQRTWFRRMQRQGFEITSLPGSLSTDDQVKRILTDLSTSSTVGARST